MLEFKLPHLGENIKSGNVVKINVSVGQTIKKDQPLLELETDKAAIEIPSPLDGVIQEILIKEGQDIKINQVIMKIAGLPIPQSGAYSAKQTGTENQTEVPQPDQSAPSAPKSIPSAKSVNIDSVSLSSEIPLSASFVTTGVTDVPAAPSVRRFAREIGVDISQVRGTGAGGRISIEDVKAYAKGILTSVGIPSPSSGGLPIPQAIASPSLPDFSKWGAVERQPMNNIRKKTAQHLTYCWTTIPHVTQFDKADITELEKLRKRYSTQTRKLTVTPFLLKVMASALKTFPQFNASVDMNTNEVVYKKYFHVGVAVDTDRGLLVPIIRDIDKKSIFQLTDELNEMAERARNKRTTLEELQGGSITLTNLGGLGGTYFTPIVNWPEVAILGVSRAQWEPRYQDKQVVARFLLPLSLSYDHRVIDGADGARFLRWVCEAIEQPFLMELEEK